MKAGPSLAQLPPRSPSARRRRVDCCRTSASLPPPLIPQIEAGPCDRVGGDCPIIALPVAMGFSPSHVTRVLYAAFLAPELVKASR